MRFLLVALLLSAVFISCNESGGEKVRGDGELVTEARTPGNYEGIRSFGSFDVYLTTGASHTVSIEAEKNLMEYIETVTEDGQLVIRTKSGYSLDPGKEIRIQVQAPYYALFSTHGSGNIIGQSFISSPKPAKLYIAGSGSIRAEITAPELVAEIAGSGDIDLKGSAKEFKGSINGSGNISALELETEDGKVDIAGSGTVRIFATGSLDVNIMGSGDVEYKGDAKINSKIAGSGSVSRTD